MTEAEFARIVALQDALWPHAARAADYAPVYELLRGIEHGEAQDAVKRHAAEGEPFPPGAPGIIRRVAEQHTGTEGASYDAAVEPAFRKARSLGAFAQPPRPEARAALAASVPEAVFEFVALHYREWSMAGGPQGDPVTVVRAQLRQAWEAGTRRAAHGHAHALAGAPAPVALRSVSRPRIEPGA